MPPREMRHDESIRRRVGRAVHDVDRLRELHAAVWRALGGLLRDVDHAVQRGSCLPRRWLSALAVRAVRGLGADVLRHGRAVRGRVDGVFRGSVRPLRLARRTVLREQLCERIVLFGAGVRTVAMRRVRARRPAVLRGLVHRRASMSAHDDRGRRDVRRMWRGGRGVLRRERLSQRNAVQRERHLRTVRTPRARVLSRPDVHEPGGVFQRVGDGSHLQQLRRVGRAVLSGHRVRGFAVLHRRNVSAVRHDRRAMLCGRLVPRFGRVLRGCVP